MSAAGDHRNTQAPAPCWVFPAGNFRQVNFRLSSSWRAVPDVSPAHPAADLAADGLPPLRIAYLCYRGKPHVGGQGVYTRHLTKALVDLGHHVEVIGGQPYPVLDDAVPLRKLPSLDIYNDHYPLRMPWIGELKTWQDWVEVGTFMAGSFPEPLAFSLRAWRYLKDRTADFDIVHDNQCLGYGLQLIERDGLPVVATIHHPITVDRKLELEHSRNLYEKVSKARWYGFTRMQGRVARQDEADHHRLGELVQGHRPRLRRQPRADATSCPSASMSALFKPVPGEAVVPGRLITTTSSDVALKGLKYLLEALAKVRVENPDAHLVIIGRRKEGGLSSDTIEKLGLESHVQFVSGVPEAEIIRLYSTAELAVVPSLYEGFSLPAIEAQACGVPLVATTGGAIPEVVGPHGETALMVPPGDSEALAAMLKDCLGKPELRSTIGAAGRKRVVDNWSWTTMAAWTVEHYRARLAEG